jgi:hypothetical protein
MGDHRRPVFELGFDVAVDPPRVIAARNARRQRLVEQRRATHHEDRLDSTRRPRETDVAQERAPQPGHSVKWLEHGGAQKAKKSSESERAPFITRLIHNMFTKPTGTPGVIAKREWWRHHLEKNLELQSNNAVGSGPSPHGRVFAPPRHAN